MYIHLHIYIYIYIIIISIYTPPPSPPTPLYIHLSIYLSAFLLIALNKEHHNTVRQNAASNQNSKRLLDRFIPLKHTIPTISYTFDRASYLLVAN